MIIINYEIFAHLPPMQGCEGLLQTKFSPAVLSPEAKHRKRGASKLKRREVRNDMAEMGVGSWEILEQTTKGEQCNPVMVKSKRGCPWERIILVRFGNSPWLQVPSQTKVLTKYLIL